MHTLDPEDDFQPDSAVNALAPTSSTVGPTMGPGVRSAGPQPWTWYVNGIIKALAVLFVITVIYGMLVRKSYLQGLKHNQHAPITTPR